MTLYEELKAGLNSAIDAREKGIPVRETIVEIPDVKKYGADDVRDIRKKCGLTQGMLARFMGVSVKTVEAWERGVNKPTGPACRLLSFLAEDKVAVVKRGFG